MSLHARTVHGGDAFSDVEFLPPTPEKGNGTAGGLLRHPRRRLFWEACMRKLRRCSRLRRREDSYSMRSRSLADIQDLQDKSREDMPSRDSTTKKGNAFPFILNENGKPMSEKETLKLGLMRFRDAPARRNNRTWTVHGGDTFASLSRPQLRTKPPVEVLAVADPDPGQVARRRRSTTPSMQW